MGMKANSGLFQGSNGRLRYELNIQLFASGKIPLEGRILYTIASNKGLKNAIIALYRPGAHVGNGSTAAAIKRELITGELVGGRSHLIKGKERMRQLEKMLTKDELSITDKIIAKKIINDLQKAYGDK
ncbi:MAG: hypothetical protein IIU06_06755 [Erysipelotrichales bacterium]|nr:hypothetical protein [Erysipelotrichales bacterium]